MPPPGNSPAAWVARIDRAQTLAGQVPAAAQALAFFCAVTEFQKAIAVSETPEPPVERQPAGLPLHLQQALERFPDLLALARREGPAPLAESAAVLAESPREHWSALLITYWESGGKAAASTVESGLFFARALLQPFATVQAAALGLPAGPPNARLCPLCGAKPVTGVLRKEALGAKRSLVCSLCLTEWGFTRAMCPACGEDDFDALPVYSTQDLESVRIDACDTCKTFIPTVDLTKNGLAIPDVDELAAVSLSLWAQEAGYTKLQANLLGL